MSRVLLIRHMPRSLLLQEKDELLRHFGAVKVWEPQHNKHVVLATFASHEVARTSLARLHQLEIGKRRLVVEYSDENNELGDKEKPTGQQSSLATENMRLFIKRLNAWNPSLDFLQPPHPNLCYKYPDASPTVFMNIIYSMMQSKVLYTQILHLMNKMCLEPPFTSNEEAVKVFIDTFKSYFVNESATAKKIVSEPESEISSGEEGQLNVPLGPKIIKRKHSLPQTRKRAATVLATAKAPPAKAKKIVNQKEIFEEVSLHEPKKISLNVSQDSLTRQQLPDTQVIGEITKLVKEPLSHELKSENDDSTPSTNEAVRTISKKELLKNKVSFRDIKVLPVFKNYHPGEPSMRLYLKNLAKDVKEEDVKRIYYRYVESLSNAEQQGFDVRVMQEGRMKGQGFVTFPSVALAEEALRETNGYLLNDKPIVVQFARASNKKPIS